jgi:predicted metal-dependent enzyme (double-stranded beta helix superfamily)
MSLLAPAGYLDRARAWADDENAWAISPRFDPARRWYHRVHTSADHEVWLLTWLPGQATDLHDHGPSAGAFVVVSGELTEQSYADESPRSMRLAAGDGREFARGHVHRVANLTDIPAVSVHVYGPRLYTMTRYQVVDGRPAVIGIDRAGVQW